MPQLNLNFDDLPIPEAHLWEQFDDEQKRLVIEILSRLFVQATRNRPLEQTNDCFVLTFLICRTLARNGSRRGRAASLPSGHRSNATAWHASVPGDANDHLVPRTRL
jgi:hypothetical protein